MKRNFFVLFNSIVCYSFITNKVLQLAHIFITNFPVLALIKNIGFKQFYISNCCSGLGLLKSIFTIIIFFGLFSISYAESIDSLGAVKIANEFFLQINKTGKKQHFKQVNLQSKLKSATSFKAKKKNPAYYLLNNLEGGFVIVSGNSKTKPILAYSATGEIDVVSVPPALQKWLSKMEAEINTYTQDGVSNVESTNFIEASSENSNILDEGKSFPEPLIKTKWGQGLYYNDYCPIDSSSIFSNNKVPVGCVATAMMQILKFWEYPAKGFGVHSYNHAIYGEQTAEFGNTEYDWETMPLTLSEHNNAIATLSYQCGVSVDMNYNATNSTSYLELVRESLVNYFGYKSNLSQIDHTNYNCSEWNSILKSELDSLRPVLMRGSTDNGEFGHAYICDGYTSDNYFHINWGWNGSFNGYYLIDNLIANISSFSFNQYAIIGIQPEEPACAVFPTTVNLASDSNSISYFRIISNSTWSIDTDQPWISVSNSVGSKSKIVTISAISANDSGQDRHATLTIHQSGVSSRTIIITQLKSNNLIPNISFTKSLDGGSEILFVDADDSLYNNEIQESDSLFYKYEISSNNNYSNIHLNCTATLDNNIILNNQEINLLPGSTIEVLGLLGRLPSGNHQLTINLDSNNEIIETDEDDNVIVKTFTIEKSNSPFVTVSDTLINVNYHNNGSIIRLNSNTKWNVVSDQEWIVSDKHTGEGDEEILLDIAENNTNNSRTGKLLISGLNLDTIVINILQTAGLPNFSPYKPSGWRDKILVSKERGTSSDNCLYDNDTIYLDYCFINNGNKFSAGSYSYIVYLDDKEIIKIDRSDSLKQNCFIYYKDFKVNPLSAGCHTFTLIIDPENSVYEFNENDNIYSKTFNIKETIIPISIYPNVLNLVDSSDKFTIKVNCNDFWNLTNDNDWIHVDKIDGFGTAEVSLTVDSNPYNIERVGKILLSNDISTEELTIFQNNNTTGKGNIPTLSLKLFPNPVSDNLNVVSSNYIDNISVVNSNGICIYKNQHCGKNFSINCSNWSNDNYILKINSSNIVYTKTFVKLQP